MKAPSGVSPEALPLPKGGGAVRSIGETFTPDLHSGTGSYQVPIWFPKGAGGFQPSESLIYSTGAGHGPFGMGWRLPIMEIVRRTDRGVPTYDDTQDTFLLDGSEIVLLSDGTFRFRIEGEFRRIRRSGSGWEVTDRGGRRFLLGISSTSRIEHTDGGVTRTFAWRIERAIDPKGNEIVYSYQRDGGQLYVDSITYGPYEIRFQYESRSDSRAERRAGFEVTTALRCMAIEYRLPASPAPLFRSYAIEYDECPYSQLSLLRKISFRGHPADGGPVLELPPLKFGYTPFNPGHQFKPMSASFAGPPPDALDKPGLDLVDLRAEALPGVVQVDGPLRRYWPNRRGTWAPPQELRLLPTHLNLADTAVALADMDGTGTADLLDLSQSPLGYIRNDPGEGWTDRVRVGRAPAFDPNDPDLRLMDLDGDGLVDAIRSTSRAFYVFRNRGEAGWDPPYAIARQHDLAVFPDVSFSDPRVKFADMTGDGLLDIVWVSGGRIDYWPALGGGRFGPRVSLSLHPSIAAGFEPGRIYFADINGDGLADVAYLANDRVLLYVNRSGHSLVPAGEVLYPPRSANAHIADILGSGLTGLLWSFPYSTTEPRNYKFLEFATGPRPYLLQSIDNGLGGNIGIEYQPSTEQALAAAERGQPWETTPPFAVQTVSRITQSDSVTGTVTSRQIRYYDGYFEGSEREFRGYGRAEVIEEGDASVPSTMTVSYFHQGRRGITPGATPEFRGALKGRLYRLEVFGTDSSGEFALHYRKEEDAYTVRQLAAGVNGRLVLFPSLATADVSTFEGGATSLSDKISLVYNDLGNIVDKHEVWDSGGGKQELHTFFRYTEDTVRWMLNLPVELMQQDAAGDLLVFRRYFYDGAPFVGLPLGQVVTGRLSRREEMAITNAQAASVYGAATPDFAAAGFHAITATNGATGWATNAVRQQHDTQGNSVAQMDAFGNTGHVVYDADGIFPVQVTDPSGRTFDASYDIRSQELVRISDPNGHETRYHFDAIRRMTAMVKPGDSDVFPTISFDYQDVTPPFSVNTRLRKASGQTGTLDSIEYFDGFGKHLQTRSSGQNGGVLVDGVRTYNRRGWEALRSVPRFSTAFAYDGTEGLDQPKRYEFRYDPLGRITETVTPDARTSRIVYQLGEIIRYDVSDTDNSAENIARGHFDTPRREAYDARGRLLGLTETNTGGVVTTTQYQLDALGRLASMTDARGVVTAAYVYDLMGRKIQVLHIDAGNRRVVYDARGDLTLRIDAEDRRIGMRYDELRRIAEVTAGAVSVERYTYDAGAGQNLAGRLALVEDEAGQVVFSYTSRGLIERKRRTIGAQSFEVDYGYDALERLTSLTYPDASAVAFEYGDGGLLDRVPGFVSKLTWNAHAQVTQVNFVNEVTENYDFDPATFYLREALVTGPAGPLYNVTYSHDAVGNPLAIADQLPQGSHVSYSREFAYDALYQILNVQATAGATALNQSYNYDPVGNFRQNGEFGGGAFFLEPGGSNRISGITQGGVDSILFGYDGDGNMVSSPGRTMQFDARGRLSRVTRADGTVVDFTYAYTGERVRKRVTSGGQTSETIYIDNLYELRGNQVVTHVLHQNRRLTTIEGGETRFLHPDHLGNIVLITNSTGDVVRQTGYLPFGTVAFSQGPAPSTRGFTGNEFDSETGLVFCGARYYDPALGRFISPDPFFLLNPEKTLATPGGLNLYVYANNNPVRQVDENGAFWKAFFGALLIAALIVATIVVGVFTGGAGFAFGILLAAAIGSSLGAAVGTYAAYEAGGNLEDGFLLGAVIGGAAGAGGYALGAAVGAAGISGVWGSILSGAAEGAVVGAGNGAIIGYGGGKGSAEDILKQMGIGFLVGAVLGGIAGWIKYSPTGISDAVKDFASHGSVSGIEQSSGAPLYQTYSTAPGIQAVGNAAGGVAQKIASSLANPVIFAGIGSGTQAVLTYHWDDIKAWLLETFGGKEKQVIV